MTIPKSISCALVLCGLLCSLADASQTPSDEEQFLLDLPVGENIRNVHVHANTARITVAKKVTSREGRPKFQIDELRFELVDDVNQSGLANPAVEAAGPSLEARPADRAIVRDTRDRRYFPRGTEVGRVRAELSRGGKRVLAVSRQPGRAEAADVTVWVAEEQERTARTKQVEKLVSAALSRDGGRVYVQRSDGLYVCESSSFGPRCELLKISTLGEPHTLFELTSRSGVLKPSYFFLVRKLGVDLYPTETDLGPDGSYPPLTRIAGVETSDYAISTLFDSETGLMLVLEHNRVRALRVGENGSELVAEMLLESGSEFRSCSSLHIETSEDPAGTMVWALGMRRNVEKPHRDREGSAEFAALVVGLPKNSEQATFEVLAEPNWKSCDRWCGYSPRIQFSKESSEVIAYTRDKAWKVEVAR